MAKKMSAAELQRMFQQNKTSKTSNVNTKAPNMAKKKGKTFNKTGM